MTNSLISRSSSVTVGESQLSRLLNTYQAAQQVEYLHIQAEIDVLLQHLRVLQQQKQQELMVNR